MGTDEVGYQHEQNGEEKSSSMCGGTKQNLNCDNEPNHVASRPFITFSQKILI